MIRQCKSDKSLQFICCTAHSLPAMVAMKWAKKVRMCIDTNSDEKRNSRWNVIVTCTHVKRSPIGNDWWCVRARASNTHIHTRNPFDIYRNVKDTRWIRYVDVRCHPEKNKKKYHAISIGWRRTCAICKPLNSFITFCLADWDRIHRKN